MKSIIGLLRKQQKRLIVFFGTPCNSVDCLILPMTLNIGFHLVTGTAPSSVDHHIVEQCCVSILCSCSSSSSGLMLQFLFLGTKTLSLLWVLRVKTTKQKLITREGCQSLAATNQNKLHLLYPVQFFVWKKGGIFAMVFMFCSMLDVKRKKNK